MIVQRSRKGAGRNNCKVIAHFRVIEDAFVRLDPMVIEHFLREGIVNFSQCRSDCREIIFRQSARIRARIGNGLVPFVKRLRDLQRALRRESEPTIRFALQGSEIVELGSYLRTRFLFFQFDNTLFAAALALDRLGDLVVPQSRRGTMFVPERSIFRVQPLLRIGQIQLKPADQSVGSLAFLLVFLECFIEPPARIFAGSCPECADDLVQLARLKLLNLVLALDDNCQRRRLHAA